MAEIRLARLPERTPVKLTIAVLPDLHQRLIDYAAVYAKTYGKDQPVAELIPAMIAAFMESDREFAKVRRASSGGPA